MAAAKGKTLDDVLEGADEEFDVDFSGEADGNDFAANLDKGRYEFLVKDVESKPSKAGDPMFHWTFTLNEGERKGKYVHLNALKKGGGSFRNKQTLEACGVDVSGPIRFKKADVVGKAVLVTVDGGTEEYGNGVEKIEPLKGATKPAAKAKSGAAAL